MIKTTLAALLFLVAHNAAGFTFSGRKIIQADNADGFIFLDSKSIQADSHVTIYADIKELTPDGRSLNTAFEEAAADWQNQTRVSIDVIREYIDPCIASNGITSIAMTVDICGEHGFGSFLAVARITISPPYDTIDEGEIFFDSAVNWDIYDGPAQYRPNGTAQDFRRVSKHEIGHILGLDHTVLPGGRMNGRGGGELLSPDDFCGISILYGTPEDCTMLLEDAVTLSGDPSTAMFTGGATADGGASFSKVFAPSDSLTIFSTVVVEDRHVGLPGNLYIVAVMPDGSLLAKNTEGSFIPITEDIDPLPPAESIMLYAANELLIVEDLIPADMGISNLNLAVYIGYSVTAEPGDLIYSSTPIQLTITDQ